MTVSLNKAVPDFSAPMTGDATFRLADCRGKTVVLYFYPRTTRRVAPRRP